MYWFSSRVLLLIGFGDAVVGLGFNEGLNRLCVGHFLLRVFYACCRQ